MDRQDRWITKRFGLRYFLGEVPLFQVNFRLARLDAHFTELPTVPDESRIRWEALPAGVDGVLYRSHPIEGEMVRLRRLKTAIRYAPIQCEHFYLSISGTFEQYLSRFSRKQRYNLKRQVTRFGEFCGPQGGLRWQRYQQPGELDEFYGLARAVSARTYQERLLNVGLPEGDDFRRQMRELAAAGEAAGYVLIHGQRPVAYIYCRARGRVLMLDFVGYDPDYAQWSPGAVLQYCMIEQLFAEGRFDMLDFGQGEAHYKRFYSTHSVRCADIYYLRRTWRNWLLVGLHRAIDCFGTAVGRRLQKAGLKDRIKKFLRGRQPSAAGNGAMARRDAASEDPAAEPAATRD
jgi:CelD/BcsL family acetyltransferase involved in cellulose biosynthesis